MSSRDFRRRRFARAQAQRASAAAGGMDVFRRGDDPERYCRGARRRPGDGRQNAGGGKGSRRGAHRSFARRRRAWRARGRFMQASRIFRGDRGAAVLGLRGPDGADRRSARRSRFGAVAQRDEDRPWLGTHAEPFARILARAFAARPQRRLAGRRRDPFARDNPVEYPSAFAHAFNADCYLIPAPALVDSPATKAALVERCGSARSTISPARSMRWSSASARSVPRRRSRASR